MCLWGVLDDCFEVSAPKAKQRKVEVSFRKLNQEDQELFRKAMQKEWNSWIENKVVSICKSRGVDPSRIIRARWVLVWKKSSDPDVKTKTAKARLVLVGWQDPDLGKIATDSPTLRKESKALVLSICASMKWTIWGADIKTAFLSGDPSQRNIYFRPPNEVREWMQLSSEDLFRLEKAAYGLAEAPKAWFTRLTRELKTVGMKQSQLDPCLFTLHQAGVLKGVCGVHVDDLLGGGTPEMDEVLNRLRKQLPFGDYRTHTIRYTGIDVRQNPVNKVIEITQETYIESLEQVNTKTLGTASDSLQDKSLLKACAGQLAWVANSTRPDQAFLASYLQGAQDKGTVSHIQMYNKAVREMKQRKLVVTFPTHVPIKDWRIMAISDAGWATRANGESQGGYVICLCDKKILERDKPSTVWVIEWSSKKLRRVVRSSAAAETLAAQNALDAVETLQALIAETVYAVSPKSFRNVRPSDPACLVIDAKCLYDALTRSCCSQAVSQEKRLMIDYAIMRESCSSQNIQVYWINNVRMCADPLTKLRGDAEPLYALMDQNVFQITVCQESGRKEKARKTPRV